jgi:uncharacterized protein (TIGR02996 family)
MGSEGVQIMTDRDALLRSICANPDDDAPRLIYADWLDEHGDPLQAEFIRLQIEFARCSEPSRRKLLAAREKELWRTLKKWRFVLGNWLTLALCDFHRGFSTTWIGTISDFQKCVDAYWLVGPIKKLGLSFTSRFRGSMRSAPKVISCPLIRHLDELNLFGPHLYDSWVQQFLECQHAARWRKVYLNGEAMTDEICRSMLASPLLSSSCEILIAAPQMSVDGRVLLERAFVWRVHVTNS